jgi:signal transduction histidine kinase
MPNQIRPAEVIRRAFPEVTSHEAENMVSFGEIQQYPVNSVLCKEGAIESTFYILLDGEVKVTKFINPTEERFLSFLKPGDFFGEMALIHDAPRAATVMTIVPTTVLEIRKEIFNDLVSRSSSVSKAMMREVSRRLRENNDLAVETLRVKAGELAAAYQQLAEVEYAKSEFLTVVAHELRTPLTVANGFLQVIRSQRLQGEALFSALDTVGKNIQEIISLTNDILFLQEMDFILPEFQSIDLGYVVASVVEEQQGRAEKSSVGLSLSIAPGLPKVLADANSLERAITAVLDNAIKFSPDGGDVNIHLDHDETYVRIRITDHGVGIPAEHLPKVFDRFFHLEEVRGHLFRGVGLGLSIARQVVEQHKGKIEVESELGKGSTFTILLNRKEK